MRRESDGEGDAPAIIIPRTGPGIGRLDFTTCGGPRPPEAFRSQRTDDAFRQRRRMSCTSGRPQVIVVVEMREEVGSVANDYYEDV